MSERTEFDLGSGDGAFIVRANGTPELIAPMVEDEDGNADEVTKFMLVVAMLHGSEDPRAEKAMDLLWDIVESKLHEVEDSTVDDNGGTQGAEPEAEG